MVWLEARRYGVLFAAVLAASLLLGCGASRTIPIGAVVSLTSPTGPQTDGEGVRDGLRLAIEEVNARGGVNGRKLELFLEDGRTDAEQAKASFDRVEKAHHPLFYVSTLSSPSSALALLAGQAQVVLFCLITNDPVVSQTNAWTFRYWPGVPTYVSVFLSILQRLGVGRLGILAVNDEGGRSFVDPLTTAFKAAGGTVLSGLFELAATDYSQSISKLRDTDAICLIGKTAELPRALEQIRASGYRGKVLANSAVADPSIVGLPQAQGVFSAVPLLYSAGFPYARELAQKYKARYEKTLGVSGAAGYDLVKLIADLLEDQEPSRGTLKTRLEQGFVHAGVFGDARLDPGRRDLELPLFPVQIVDGAVRYQ